jgi:poly [ADP-ribose] polymerase 2/3/4
MSRSGVPYDATLNQTDSKKNSNTSYIIQIIEKKNGEFVCWTRWGSIGEKGQADALGDGTLADAVKQFEKKFKDKAGLLWAKRGSPPVTGKVSALASG